MPDVGDTVTYDITLSNPGTDPATGVTLTSAVGATYAPAGPYTIPAGGQITVTGTWVPTTAGTFVEAVTVASTECGGASGSITYVITDPGGSTTVVLCQEFAADTFTVPPVTPGPGGITRVVNSVAEFNAAAAAANPGDVIDVQSDLTQGGAAINYDGNSGASSGVPGNHITITSSNGSEMTGNFLIFNLANVDHVDVVGLQFRATGGPGSETVAISNVSGTAASPVKFMGNSILDSQTASLGISQNSSYVDVWANTIDAGGIIEGLAWFNEGIYVGESDTSDRSNNISIRYNDISNTNADGVEIKGGPTDIDISDNTIHDIIFYTSNTGNNATPTGAIAVWPVFSNTGSLPANPNITIRRNRIWNIRQAPAPYNGLGIQHVIAIHWGGVTVESNIMWDYDDGEAVTIQSFAGGQYGSQPIVVRGNTTQTGKNSVNIVSGSPSVTQSSNIPANGTPAHVGPTSGTANAGDGPGSGFALTASAGGGAGLTDATGFAPNNDVGALAFCDV